MFLKPATSYNREYLASCLRHSAQIQPYDWTSDTLKTLDETAAKKPQSKESSQKVGNRGNER
jgi:hypothetical protein